MLKHSVICFVSGPTSTPVRTPTAIVRLYCSICVMIKSEMELPLSNELKFVINKIAKSDLFCKNLINFLIFYAMNSS